MQQGACGKPQALFVNERRADGMAEIKSEHTKDMTAEEREELRARVESMTPEELRQFRNSLDADSMGFFGEESV